MCLILVWQQICGQILNTVFYINVVGIIWGKVSLCVGQWTMPGNGKVEPVWDGKVPTWDSSCLPAPC